MDALLTTLLDLDRQLGGNAGLCIGGGLGLYLKQQHLRTQPDAQTMFPFDALPEARTTEDIDWFLRAEVVADPKRMVRIRTALDTLGCIPIETAKFMQFRRPLTAGYVKIDVLAGPPGNLGDAIICSDNRRMRPKGPSVGLHAHAVDEAVAIEISPIKLQITGKLSSGEPHSTMVYIPQTFSYLLMKLTAFGDRLQDANKNLGRHHALDAYRLVGLLTRDEDVLVSTLSEQYRNTPAAAAVRKIVQMHFGDPDAIGLLRIREHPLYTRALRLDDFRRELMKLFPPI